MSNIYIQYFNLGNYTGIIRHFCPFLWLITTIYPVHDSTPLHSCRAAGVGPSLDSGAANTHINTPTQTWVHYNLLETSVHLEVIWFVWWFFGIVERFNMVKLFYPPVYGCNPCTVAFAQTISFIQWVYSSLQQMFDGWDGRGKKNHWFYYPGIGIQCNSSL